MEKNIEKDTASNKVASLGVWPRGLRRADAARYLGISTSHFDKQRMAGAIPDAKSMLGVTLYDRCDLDQLFDGIAGADNDNASDYWDKQCDTVNPNS